MPLQFVRLVLWSLSGIVVVLISSSTVWYHTDYLEGREHLEGENGHGFLPCG